MPKKAKLDKKQLEQYKKLLLQLKDDMLHDIKNMSNTSSLQESGTPDAGHAQHMADVATDMYDREFNLGLASHEREVLQKIEDALERIKDGTYGFCLGTGKQIKAARLKALPYAENCLEHQEELENQK